MLTEIRSTAFRKSLIKFHPGLNVILGDENATNSIGKSSALMVIDFVFGGDSFVEHNEDAVRELGDHSYLFCFKFEDECFYFRRDTVNPSVVFRCDPKYAPIDKWDLKAYTAWLKSQYFPEALRITFRGMVGLFSRIWPKPNVTNVRRPLHVFPGQSGSECVSNLIKVFNRYGEVEAAQTATTDKKGEKNALRNAFRHSIVEKITKAQYSKNVVELENIRTEVDTIKSELSRFALNLREVIDQDLLELKKAKDLLLSQRLRLRSKLQRTERNLKENKFIQSKQFEALCDFFPNVNHDRIAEIELFHSSLSAVLKKELQETEKAARLQLDTTDNAIAELDRQISERLNNYDNPVALIERVSGLSGKWSRLRRENDHFEKQTKIDIELAALQEALSSLKIRILKDMESSINAAIRAIVDRIYGPESRAPALELNEDGYTYQIVDDTGTGTAYANLVIFDLAILELTQLPFLIHDSPLFKNVENNAVAKFVDEYRRSNKQVFISLDQIKKYGAEAAAELESLCVLQLDKTNVLYTANWGKK
ncbi:DUF2326 domain-containing protein [Pusillimonas sp. TS35]|uniref:DUF2326 domain-containing protein n=1 Tax=Paracandidimonas lactea TaxID=2895524 RepID=UPI00136F20D1|nr:DUF2326 domain-containing protein [Paracandidimonas lactea]MYN13525.1 DUF2326 domain-containing protein [Pusillimonas sp. TS35]